MWTSEISNIVLDYAMYSPEFYSSVVSSFQLSARQNSAGDHKIT